ncbi:exodeoxyribonuclease VII small subunit [Phycisphaera mikurensis]|uniref:Exodeoxyribonuclease 7 small subunit n=1 Tax=Phycisphaera mikurensis (strain NBRC 102666 / KCTC 22515 / FYK2301M01) TaxID=1142394 RepID=I0IFH0_PHYMF|nr:exodeoxyribonuclease VII small subunit [Phycisphaera mikurensis]MBB6440600.1 exodeoxyribonuclease VII small subunit [Phycisphaera mikurensis]BAM04008.1 exodeoxyribonuclease VII small subunit [Phycisphaera mikurensis NBRC 102666]
MPDPAETADVEAMPFEQALTALEGLIERVESGETSLEDALRDYAAGTALIQRCRDVLDTAETRMAELVIDAGGPARVAEGDA